MSDISRVSQEVEVKPRIDPPVDSVQEQEDRKPIIADDDDDPVAIATFERVRLLQRERENNLENYHLKTSKLDMEEKLVRIEEENRRLRLANHLPPRLNVKEEPRDIKPVINTSGHLDASGSSMRRGTNPDGEIIADSDDDGVVFVSAKWAATAPPRPRTVPITTPIIDPVRPDLSDVSIDAHAESTRVKVKRRKRSSRLSDAKRAKATQPWDAALRILKEARQWAGSQMQSVDPSDSEAGSKSQSESESSPEPDVDTSEDYKPLAGSSGSHGIRATRVDVRPARRSQIEASERDEGSESEDDSGSEKEDLKVSSRKPRTSRIRDRKGKGMLSNNVLSSAEPTHDDESDSDQDLTTSCKHYEGARLRIVSVDHIGHRLDRVYRRHGLTKTTIQVLEKWWPKTKVGKYHCFDTTQSYLLLFAVHAWWSRLLGIISEEGYEWPARMGETPAWMLSRVREIVLQKEAAAERAEREMKSQGASISTKAVINLKD